MLIKVCGLTNNDSGKLVSKLEYVSHVGFIFYEKSKRFTTQSFTTDKKKVGVFVNASPEEIERLIDLHQLDCIQLHGDETPAFIAQLSTKVEIIKAIGISDQSDLKKADEFEGLVSAMLFDTKSKERGGTGTSFDWKVLQNYKGKTPFILSGGLGLHNIEQIQNFKHDKLIGYDLNSCFEESISVKNPDLIKSFIEHSYENVLFRNR